MNRRDLLKLTIGAAAAGVLLPEVKAAPILGPSPFYDMVAVQDDMNKLHEMQLAFMDRHRIRSVEMPVYQNPVIL